MSAIAHALWIARIDVTRMVRKHTDWGRGIGAVVGIAVAVLLGVAATLGGGYLGYTVGQGLAGGASVDLGPFSGVTLVGGILALGWVVGVVVFVVRAIGQRGTLAQPEGILTVVPTREALAGTVLAEFVFLLLWILPPASALGIGLAVGSGVPWPAVAVPLAAVGVGAAAVSVGYPLGVGVRHVVTRFAFVARNKGAILVVVFVAYFGALSSGAVDQVMVALFEPMQSSPVAWFAHLGLLGLPGLGASPLLAGASLVLSVAVAGVGIVGGTAIADRHWFSDPAMAGEPEPEAPTERASDRLEGVLERVLARPTAALVALSWRRAKRSPLKLLYAMYPLLVLAGTFADIVQTGQIPTYLPYAMVVFVAWAAGVMFTLNPVGDQGSVLPATLLSRVDGATFVRGHLLASLLVALPIGVLATAVVAVLGPVDATTAALLVVTAPVVMVLSSVVSVGLGVAFPKFEATNVTRSMKTVLPSVVAFALFTAYLLVTTVAAISVYEPLARVLVSGLLSLLIPFGVEVSARVVYYAAVVALVTLALTPVAAYRYAVTRFDGYTLA